MKPEAPVTIQNTARVYLKYVLKNRKSVHRNCLNSFKVHYELMGGHKKALLLIALPVRLVVAWLKTLVSLRSFFFLFLFRDLNDNFIKSLERLLFDSRLHSRKRKHSYHSLLGEKNAYNKWRLISSFAHETYEVSGHEFAAELHKEAFEISRIQNEVECVLDKSVKIFGPEWASNIGHIVNLSLFPKLEKLEWISQESRILFYSKTANESLLEKYRCHYSLLKVKSGLESVLDSNFRFFSQPMEVIDTSQLGVLDLYSAQTLIEEKLRDRYGDSFHLLNVSEEEIEKGQNFLQSCGIESSDWFVTFHMREASDKSSLRGGDNVDPSTYLEAMKLVLDNGGVVIRLGNSNMTPLESLGLRHPRVIDYAHEESRDSALDIYFLSQAKFLVGTGSGPILVPNEFGKPVLYTNVPAVGRTRRLRGWCLPQIVADADSGRKLNIHELLSIPLGWNIAQGYKNFYRIKNSPEEIKIAVAEMLKWTNKAGNFWQEPNVQISQRRFGYEGNFANWSIGIPISNGFLAKHAELYKSDD